MATQDLPSAVIAVKDPTSGAPLLSQQRAMPLGAVGAVYAWDNIAEAITTILCDVFLLPIARYVDDIFLTELEDLAEDARSLFLEVVSAFGLTLELSKTPDPAEELIVLGVHLSLQQSA
eukprot:8166886-Heterocapsa_arctica.AAC.1